MSTASAISREPRGFSITQNVPPAARPYAEKLPHRKLFYPQLSDKLMADLKVLYPYIRDIRVQEIPFDELVRDMKYEMYPEGAVFWWQRHVLYTFFALTSWDTLFDDNPVTLKPLHPKTLAHHATLRKYLRFPKTQRLRFNRIILQISLNREEYKVKRLEEYSIIAAMNEVDAALEHKSLKIDKLHLRRLAKFSHHTCFACNTIENETSACARCRKVFYCSKDCQKAHWPKHKKYCMSKPMPLTADTKKNTYLQLDLD